MRALTVAVFLANVGHAGVAVAAPADPAPAASVVAAPATPTPAPAVAAPQARTITLAANTDIGVTPDETLNSKKVKSGDTFKLKTVNDITQDGVVVIPAGTPGTGQISATKKPGSFGKSGKMEVAFQSLDLANGDKLPLTGTYQEQGHGNGGATAGAIVGAGLIGGFLVSGHSANIEHGQVLHAQTAQSLTITATSAAAPAATAPEAKH